MTRLSPRKELAKVDSWNLGHPVGTVVRVTLDGGAQVDTFTVAPASLLGGHTAVLWLKNISGCYRLDRCTAIP